MPSIVASPAAAGKFYLLSRLPRGSTVTINQSPFGLPWLPILSRRIHLVRVVISGTLVADGAAAGGGQPAIGEQILGGTVLGPSGPDGEDKWTAYARHPDLDSTTLDLKYLPRITSRVRLPSPAPLISARAEVPF